MYIGIDLGTSSVKSILIDEQQTVLASATAELSVSREHEGWSEQDPQSWLSAVDTTLKAIANEQHKAMAAVKGIGLSGHMHGATLLDKNDNVLRPCILWNDTRSHVQAEQLDTEASRALCGNILFPGFTSPKLAWVAENEPTLFDQIGKVLLPKDYVRFWLSGEFVAEMSDAAGTGWLDVAKRDWSDELLAAVNLDRSHMPSLVEGTQVSAKLKPALAEQYGMSANVVIAGGAGDNAAAACGMGTTKPGDAFLSLGTSGVLFAANDAYLPNAQSAVHTFCHALPNVWHQMGVILAATDTLNWLATLTGKTPAELTKELGEKPTTPSDIIFLPYLGGERTPHNDAKARGVFVGLSHNSDTQAMVQAVLQGVTFAFRDCQQALLNAGTTLEDAYAVGGGAKSTYWLNMLSSALNLPLKLPVDGDFGASLGAARLAIVAAENADTSVICTPPAVDKLITPTTSLFDAYEEQYDRYQKTYQALRSVMS